MGILNKALNQVQQKQPEIFGQELNYYKVTDVIEYPMNVIGIEVYFVYTKAKKEYTTSFNQFDVPEGEYRPNNSNLMFIVNPDNSVTFFYKMYNEHANIFKYNLEPLLEEIMKIKK